MGRTISKPYLVTVIMSTYNGEKYIEAQLNSLLEQSGVLINLLVRDDGSRDNTVTIVNSYSDKFNHVRVIKGNNVGATASFFSAAKSALDDEFKADFYAFCDQDDIWLPDKLIIGIKKICDKNKNMPVLYFSNLMLMNTDGKLMGKLLDDSVVCCNKYNAMAAIYTYGCTCVFNKCALEKFCCLYENNIIFHDNWMYAVCVFLGEAVYDTKPNILYRQTGSNVSGDKKKGIGLWIQRIKKIFYLNDNDHVYENIANKLIKYFETYIECEDLALLTHICNYRKNIKDKIYLLLTKRMKTGKFSKDICIMGRIIINKL